MSPMTLGTQMLQASARRTVEDVLDASKPRRLPAVLPVVAAPYDSRCFWWDDKDTLSTLAMCLPQAQQSRMRGVVHQRGRNPTHCDMLITSSRTGCMQQSRGPAR